MSVARRGAAAGATPEEEAAAQSIAKASKRNSGLFAFLRWFRPASSRESLPASGSSSSGGSCGSLDSSHSAGTVASFAFVPPDAYEGGAPCRRIAPGPETDTYRARLRQRDRRRECDRDLTLRKKYNLFLHVDAAPPTSDENTHSLPLMTRTPEEDPRVHRRTNSESSKVKRAGAYLHVKGKRKAPQPPAKVGETSTASLRRRKRLAPPPPPQPDKEPDVICNDSLKLDHGVLKPVKETESENNPPSAHGAYVSPASPRPWYKRHSTVTTTTTTSSKGHVDDDKYEPIEVQFKANDHHQKSKDEKRKSGVSYLANISELDREAGEIIRNRDQNAVPEMPEFMRPKDAKTDSADSWVSPKRRSAKDLIAKFNAITNVTKVTVFGASQKDARLFGKQTSLDETRRRQESLLESHRKRLEEIDRKNAPPLLKSESASAIKPRPETPKLERKNWRCPKCNLENEYWRIICHVCSAIKPYFDDFSSSPRGEPAKETSSPLAAKKEATQRPEAGFERSRTQIGFSALAANRNRSAEAKQDTPKKRNDEKEKLKKMLIEMKNSLPKRKSNILQRQSRASVIVENPENNPENELKPEEPAEAPPKEPEKTQEEKVAEILIGTQTKIYENIKVRRIDNRRPAKVSSSAQTSGVLKQTEQPAKATREYEPMRPKDFEEIYSDAGSKSAARIYANLARNDELSIFFNMPKGAARGEAGAAAGGGPRNATDTIEINRLLRRLETAIGKGDLGEAAAFAKELAQLKVNCSVVRQKPSPPRPAGGRRGIQIEMYVEDKVSHRGPFPLEVLPTQTVAELKLQVQKEFEIPAEYQRWILGKELVTNEDSTLRDHDVNSEGCPVFLYLVAPDPKARPDRPKGGKTETTNSPSTSKATEAPPEEKKVPEQNGFEKVKSNVQNLQKILRENRKDPDHVPKIVNVIPKPAQEAKVVSVQRVEVKTASVDVKVEAPSAKTAVLSEGTEPGRQKVEQRVEGVQAPKVVSAQVASAQVASAQVTPAQVTSAQVTPSQVASAQVTPAQVASAQVTPGQVVPKQVTPGQVVAGEAAPVENDYDTLRPAKEWECHLCTLLNPVSSNVCAACASVRLRRDVPQPARKKRAPQPRPRNDQTYLQLMDLDNTDLVGNVEPFECVVCFLEVATGEGVTLRECLHQFCRACLAQTVEFNEEAEVKCPYRDDEYSCNIALQDREIKALVSSAVYEQHLAKSVAQAENKIDKSFHCKTPDCKGWCIFEDNVNEFRCPVCRRINCLTCQAIHMGMNCKQYQEKMNDESEIDDDARRTRDMLEEMVRGGEAIECPTCRVVLMKKWGCDWLRCSMCKTEICWVTRGPRWGPAGKGDTSGGCQCGLNGVKCHPKCNYCH